MTTPKKLMAMLCLLLLICGCSPSQTKTFAGFTFGGGGNTFSSEPCELTIDVDSGSLTAGKPGEEVYLMLQWQDSSAGFNAQQVVLSEANVSVLSKGGSATLKDGHIVLQARDGTIGHGSFDLTANLEDGREVTIVGSFTASIQP